MSDTARLIPPPAARELDPVERQVACVLHYHVQTYRDTGRWAAETAVSASADVRGGGDPLRVAADVIDRNMRSMTRIARADAGMLLATALAAAIDDE